MADEAEPSDLDSWKFRAPYKIHKPSDEFNAVYRGSCHCGQVQYELSRDAPLSSKFCHCLDCQVQHGAPFQWATIFHKEDMNFISGDNGLEWYDPSTMHLTHVLPCKVRCSHCHTPIMDEGRNMCLLFPSLIRLDSAEARRKFEPQCHMFYSQRVMDIPDGLPKWSGMNKVSELIEDSPVEMMRDLERERGARH